MTDSTSADDELQAILQQVADGRLTPEEAEALLGGAMREPASTEPAGTGPRRAVRLQVTERGRTVVDLRIPMSIASMAGSVVPGLASAQMERLGDAIRGGEVGPILEIQDERGDGVVISTE